ncbi:2024_t:CDS:2, partial [Ambispora gerdemannii]
AVEAQSLRELSEFLTATVRQTLPPSESLLRSQTEPSPTITKRNIKTITLYRVFRPQVVAFLIENCPFCGTAPKREEKSLVITKKIQLLLPKKLGIHHKMAKQAKSWKKRPTTGNGNKLLLTNASNQNVTDNLKNSRRPSNNNDNSNPKPSLTITLNANDDDTDTKSCSVEELGKKSPELSRISITE